MIDFGSLPRDIGRRAHCLYLTLALMASRSPTGVVDSTRKEIQRAAQIDHAPNFWVELATLERRGLVTRVPRREKERLCLWVASSIDSILPRCANCRYPVTASATYCAQCRQAFRRDRAWQHRAVNLAVEQLATKGRVDPLAIHVAVGRPLWRQADDDDNQSGAVVPYLLGQGLLGDEWAEALREAIGDAEYVARERSRRA